MHREKSYIYTLWADLRNLKSMSKAAPGKVAALNGTSNYEKNVPPSLADRQPIPELQSMELGIVTKTKGTLNHHFTCPRPPRETLWPKKQSKKINSHLLRMGNKQKKMRKNSSLLMNRCGRLHSWGLFPPYSKIPLAHVHTQQIQTNHSCQDQGPSAERSEVKGCSVQTKGVKGKVSPSSWCGCLRSA